MMSIKHFDLPAVSFGSQMVYHEKRTEHLWIMVMR